MTTNSINERELVLDILLEVNKNKVFSHIAIARMLSKYQYLEKQQRAFITRLAKGTIEWQIREDYVIEQFSKIRVSKMKPVIREILRMSVYQIFYMDSVPDSAVCNEAVNLAAKRGFKNLKGFVNGVLRNIVRNKNQIPWIKREENLSGYLSVEYSVPEWIIKKWLLVYECDTVEKILGSFLKENKTSVRILSDRDKTIQSLKEEGVTVEPNPYISDGVYLSGYDYLEDLDAFCNGWITVQDTSSMMAGKIADPKMGDYCIDVCAAPGGKSIHLAQLLKGTGMVEARDVSENKIGAIEENIERAGFSNIRTKLSDGTVPDKDSIETADIVLADVPCSGLGVLGKKYDLKYNMTEEKIKDIEKLQKAIVKNAVSYVKKGGTFVYSTCTINRGENENMVTWLLENFPLESVDISSYLEDETGNLSAIYCDTAKKGYIQFLPGIHQSDGFFIAKFRKK